MKIDRRDFIGMSSAFSLAECMGLKPCASALERTKWKIGHYQVHFIYTGRSECMFHIFPDGTSMLLDCGDSVRDLYASQAAEFRAGRRKMLNENALSCGMIIRYGKFSYFTAGDFSDGRRTDLKSGDIENELAEAVGPVTVAKMNHHAHHSMSSGLVKALKAKVWTNCTLDQQHCTDDSMIRMSSRSLYEGERILLPTYMPQNRRATKFGTSYLADVPDCVRRRPCHVICDVAPGGNECVFFCRDAMQSGNPVVGEFCIRL